MSKVIDTNSDKLTYIEKQKAGSGIEREETLDAGLDVL